MDLLTAESASCSWRCVTSHIKNQVTDVGVETDSNVDSAECTLPISFTATKTWRWSEFCVCVCISKQIWQVSGITQHCTMQICICMPFSSFEWKNCSTVNIISSSSNPFTPCGAQDIHEELPGIAISSYIPLTSFHDLPVLLISSSIVLRHVLFGLPLLPYPWGFQCPSIYGATAPSGPWPPSKCASTRHHFLLFSSIFSFLIVAMHLSGPRPPIWYVPSAKNQFLFLIAESLSICWTLPRHLWGFQNITFFSRMGLSAPHFLFRDGVVSPTWGFQCGFLYQY